MKSIKMTSYTSYKQDTNLDYTTAAYNTADNTANENEADIETIQIIKYNDTHIIRDYPNG